MTFECLGSLCNILEEKTFFFLKLFYTRYILEISEKKPEKKVILCLDFATLDISLQRFVCTQGREEELLRIGVALTFSARFACEIYFSATPNFWLFGVALRIKCGREI